MAGLMNVTDIVKKLTKFPQLKEYLENIDTVRQIVKRNIHREFMYPESVINNRSYSYYGVFIDYFIRKCFSCKYNLKIKDHRAEWYLHQFEDDEEEDDELIAYGFCSQSIPQIPNFKESYEIFKDPSCDALQNVDHIINVSQAHTLFFGERLPSVRLDYNIENLEEIVNYIHNLQVNNPQEVMLNPIVGGKYFKCDCDLIIDNVIIDIKNSKNQIPSSMKPFYQLIMYSFGAFENYNKRINKFIIYNPLLGIEYILKLDEIDFDAFENALRTLVT